MLTGAVWLERTLLQWETVFLARRLSTPLALAEFCAVVTRMAAIHERLLVTAPRSIWPTVLDATAWALSRQSFR